MRFFIYDSPHGYVVLSGAPWPYGQIERICLTKWGARRFAKKLKNRRIESYDLIEEL